MNNCRRCQCEIPDGDLCVLCEDVVKMDGAVHPVFNSHAIVIGVDPSLNCTGVVIVDRFGVVAQTTISSDSSRTVEDRVHQIDICLTAHLINTKVEAWNSIMCVEMNHVTAGRSAQSALHQRELIGVICHGYGKIGTHVVRVAPTTAKKALTGSGKATKEMMVEQALLYPGFRDMGAIYKNQATADALGVALAGMDLYNG